MSFELQLERITAAPSGSKLFVELIDISLDSESESDFLSTALQRINQQTGASGSVLVQGIKGQWRVISHDGEGDGLPSELLADTLDAESTKQAEDWTASPLFKPNQSSYIDAR